MLTRDDVVRDLKWLHVQSGCPLTCTKLIDHDAAQRARIESLRSALIKCTNAIGNGSGACEKTSDAFLCGVHVEILLEMESQRARIAELEEQNAKMKEVIAEFDLLIHESDGVIINGDFLEWAELLCSGWLGKYGAMPSGFEKEKER